MQVFSPNGLIKDHIIELASMKDVKGNSMIRDIETIAKIIKDVGGKFKMNVSKTLENGKITIALDGRLDSTTSPQLQEVLIPAFDETKEVELDLTQLNYMSSAGIRILLMGLKTAQAKDASMVVSGVSQEIMEILEMTGLSDLLTFK